MNSSDSNPSGSRSRRQTNQQSVLWKVLVSSLRPLSVDELLAAAGPQLPTLNQSTVYRAIKRWIEDEKIVAVEIAGRGTFYEPTEVAQEHHHHFFCSSCKQVLDVPGCAAGLSALLPQGFELHSHSITLEGHCSVCVSPA